jgi:hypothetical protein
LQHDCHGLFQIISIEHEIRFSKIIVIWKGKLEAKCLENDEILRGVFHTFFWKEEKPPELTDGLKNLGKY